MILEWLLKIDNVWVVIVWVVMCSINGISWLVSLYSVGIISSRFCDEVKEVERVLVCSVLCMVLMVFVFDCILIMWGILF